MYLKQYRKPTVREALRAIRQELGPDALVVSTEMVAAEGWRGWIGRREVQLTAGADRQVSASRPPAADRRLADVAGTPRLGIVARLVATGIDRSLAEAAASMLTPAECRGATAATLRQALAGQLTTLAIGDEPQARIEVFVGPPGVGKTTTIAKIAAQERARRGKSLGMVAADAFRAGAVEQLRTYADIIGAPFHIARSAEELQKALTSTRQPLLIDTAGRSPSDEGVHDLLRVLRRRKGVRTHLVIAADTSAASARRIFEAYSDHRPDRLVITKVDEAESLTPLVCALHERQLPVSYVSAGQRVPEDLDRATPALLAGAVLRDRPAMRTMTARQDGRCA